MNTTGTGTTRHTPDARHAHDAAAAPAHDTAHDTAREPAPDDTAIDTALNAATAPAAAGGGRGGVVGGAAAWEPAWELAAEPRAASRARDLTARTLRGWRFTDPDDIGDVVLMVGELVTNAVVHGAGPVRLALRLDGRRLHAEVADADPAPPAAPAEPRPLDWAEAGRGLLLVAALAADHGARPDGTGKTVWFTRLLNPPAGHHPHPPSPR